MEPTVSVAGIYQPKAYTRVLTNDFDLVRLRQLAMDLVKSSGAHSDDETEGEESDYVSSEYPPSSILNSKKTGSKEVEKTPINKEVKYNFAITATIPVSSSLEKSFTAYLVQITETKTRISKELLKRYRQFFELHEHIKADYPKKEIPKLPRKKYVGNTKSEFVERRCRKIENYLNALTALRGIFDKSYMKQFMELKDLPSRYDMPSKFDLLYTKKNSFLINPAKKEGRFPRTSSFDLGETPLQNEDMIVNRLKICKNSSLPVLELNNLDIRNLDHTPLSAEWMTSLKGLDLSTNQLRALPDLRTLQNLEYLNLAWNRISSVDLLASFVKLKNLNLSNNSITKVDALFQLTNLEELHLNGNLLGALPSSISSCKNLEILNLENCSLVVLPDEFTELAHLLELNLKSNNLTELPADFGKLSRLTSLDLTDNDLKDLPLSMGLCENLRYLQVTGNTFEDASLGNMDSFTLINLLKDKLNEWRVSVPSIIDEPSKKAHLEVPEEPELGLPIVRSSSPAPTRVPELRAGSPSLAKVSIQDERVMYVRKWALSQLKSEILPKLLQLKANVEKVGSIQEARSLTQITKQLKEVVDEASSQEYWKSVQEFIDNSKSKNHPPLMTEDKLENFKRTILNIVTNDLRIIIAALKYTLENSSTPVEIVYISKIIKDFSQILSKVNEKTLS